MRQEVLKPSQTLIGLVQLRIEDLRRAIAHLYGGI